MFKLLKTLSYAFGIGCIFYAGGYGWACLFTKYRVERKRMANYSILLGLIVVALFVGTFIVGAFHDHDNQAGPYADFMFLIFRFFLFHCAVSVIGLVFYFINGIINWIFPNKYLNYGDEYSSGYDDYCLDPKFKTGSTVCDERTGEKLIVKQSYQYFEEYKGDDTFNTYICFKGDGSIVEYAEYNLTTGPDEILKASLSNISSSTISRPNSLENRRKNTLLENIGAGALVIFVLYIVWLVVVPALKSNSQAPSNNSHTLVVNKEIDN
jgi:hypothetical protein